MKRPPLSKSPAMEVSTCAQMVAVLCKVIILMWNRMKCHRRAFDEQQVVELHLVAGSSRCVCTARKCGLLGRVNTLTLIKLLHPVVPAVIQRSSPLHLYDLNRYFFYCPFYASKCSQLCWNVIFICLCNVATMAVCLKSMRLFLRLIIHSLFCCSWEIYDWIHDYIKTVSRLTDLKTTHLKTTSFSPSFFLLSLGKVQPWEITQINEVFQYNCLFPTPLIWLSEL